MGPFELLVLFSITTDFVMLLSLCRVIPKTLMPREVCLLQLDKVFKLFLLKTKNNIYFFLFDHVLGLCLCSCSFLSNSLFPFSFFLQTICFLHFWPFSFLSFSCFIIIYFHSCSQLNYFGFVYCIFKLLSSIQLSKFLFLRRMLGPLVALSIITLGTQVQFALPIIMVFWVLLVTLFSFNTAATLYDHLTTKVFPFLVFFFIGFFYNRTLYILSSDSL